MNPGDTGALEAALALASAQGNAGRANQLAQDEAGAGLAETSGWPSGSGSQPETLVNAVAGGAEAERAGGQQGALGTGQRQGQLAEGGETGGSLGRVEETAKGQKRKRPSKATGKVGSDSVAAIALTGGGIATDALVPLPDNGAGAGKPGEAGRALEVKPVTSKWKHMRADELTISVIPQLLVSYENLLKSRAEEVRDPLIPQISVAQWWGLASQNLFPTP